MEDQTPTGPPSGPEVPSEPPEPPRVSAPRLIPEAPRWPEPPAGAPPGGAFPPAFQPPQVPPISSAVGPPPPPWAAPGQLPYAAPPPPPGAQPPGPPAAAQPPKKTGRGVLIVIAIACAVLLIGAVVLVVALAGTAGGGGGFAVGPQIGVIRVEGIISASSGPSLFSISGGSDGILEEIKRATADKSVKAFIIRINSPGGAAGAAQELHGAIVNLRKKSGKPVIVSMGDVAASGGYYVAAAADKIVANPATMTGSIGVAMDTYEIAGLMEKYGVGATAITSGKYKDTGSMFRKVRPDERELMQQMVDDVYQQFLKAVYEGRRTHLTESQVRSLTNGEKKSASDLTVDDFKRVADGRVLTGHQAYEKGLVDELGGMTTAVDVAKQAAGIQGNVQLKDYSRRAPFEELFGGAYGSSETPLARDLLLLRDLDPVTRILRAPTLSIR